MDARLVLLPIVAIALAACSGQASGSERAEATESRTSHVIPRKFRGRWAESPAACLSHNSRRYEIAAGRIDTASFGGDVEQVRVAGGQAVVRLALQTEEARFSMHLVDDNTMRASYGERKPFILRLCR